jgi:hypothetical protein
MRQLPSQSMGRGCVARQDRPLSAFRLSHRFSRLLAVANIHQVMVRHSFLAERSTSGNALVSQIAPVVSSLGGWSLLQPPGFQLIADAGVPGLHQFGRDSQRARSCLPCKTMGPAAG